jgi:pantetheine-phosphate adenylyltransferase
MNKRIAVFAGTFDPVTMGHVDVVRRAAPLFDEIIIAIGVNTAKKTLFSLDKRTEWLERTFSDLSNIRIEHYEGLTVNFCESMGAKYLLRGLRNGTDFDYEAHIAQLNKSLDSKIETVFMMTSPEFSFISSTLVRDLVIHQGDYQPYVPNSVEL